MNESTREELNQLKRRQNYLASELYQLGERIQFLEERLAQPIPAAKPPVPELETTRAPTTPVIPPPVFVSTAVPPVLPPKPVPPPIPPSVATVVQPAQVPPLPDTAAADAQGETPKPAHADFASIRARLHGQEPVVAAGSTGGNAEHAPASAAPAAKKSSFEMRLGTFWLVRIGIVMLLTGFVFFGTYAYQHYVPMLGKAGKVSMLYLASAALLGTGTWLQRRQATLKNYAQVLVAGGLAAVYFTTYAAHFIPNLQIIQSALLAGALLLGWACFITWLADRKKSEPLALFAILLAYYTSAITNVGLFTLYSNLILTLAAVFFLLRNRWAAVSFVSLVATYAGYAFWRFYYQHGHWQWAAPTEGLSTGIYFLVSYWAVFTAAMFASNHEQFAGKRRASFLSLNNGAFFSCFLLTMIQVHQGGFWKFSLIYGAAQLALTGLAWQLRREDKLFRNTFLTQGLLLVTLGFITYFAGFKLSLVLGVESVILLVLGRQMQNRVLEAGSYVAALLAAGWCAPNIQAFDQTGLRTGGAVGALMMLNAFQFRKATAYDRSANHAPTLLFTLLALALWLETTWQNSSPLWRGLVLGIEGAVFLVAARPLGNRMLELGSVFFSVLAVSVQTEELLGQFQMADLPQRTGLLQAVLLGGLMLANSLIQRRISPSDGKRTFNPPVTLFAGLAMLIALGATYVFTRPDFLAPLLALEAAVFTASFYVLRLAEMPLFGQAFLLLAQALWIAGAGMNEPPHPWWNPASVIAITLAISQWWQRQRAVSLLREIRMTIHLLYALAVVGLLFFWFQPKFPGSQWLAITALFAIALTVYGIATRFWLLAAAGQIFMLIAGWEFVHQLLTEPPVWYFPLIPLAAFLLLALGTVRWFQRRPEANPEIARPLLAVSQAYRIVALLMSLWWVYKYVPPREQCWSLALVGTVLFLLAGWRRNRETLIFSAIFTATALVCFCVADPDVPAVYWPNFIALLLLPIQERMAKRQPDRYAVPPRARAAAMVLGALSIWLYVSRWVGPKAEGIYLTAAWSALALVMFITGMYLRERIYRWLGLGVLACALGRVVIFDIWKLETIYRILSFMALGIVLLILGFIYNKYQERIKEWL